MQARVARCRLQVHHAARIRGGHRESARSGDADDGEGAEVDSDEPVSREQTTGNGIQEYGKRHHGKRGTGYRTGYGTGDLDGRSMYPSSRVSPEVYAQECS